MVVYFTFSLIHPEFEIVTSRNGSSDGKTKKKSENDNNDEYLEQGSVKCFSFLARSNDFVRNKLFLSR